MLRKSLAALSPANLVSSPRKRSSLKLRKQSIKTRQVNSQTVDGRESLQITIAPERIQRFTQYIKYFCPVTENEWVSVNDLESLLRKPKSGEEKFDPALVSSLQTVDLFSRILANARMDYLDWFSFVATKSKNSDALSLQDFCSEINRLCHDVQAPNFDNQILITLFITMTKNSDIKDEKNCLTLSQFESFMKDYYMIEQDIRTIDITRHELLPMSYYLIKNNISLQTILEVTNSEIAEGKMKISQIEFLLSSLMLMYEIYCKEFGAPTEDELFLNHQQASTSVINDTIHELENDIMTPPNLSRGVSTNNPGNLTLSSRPSGISGLSADFTPTPFSDPDMYQQRVTSQKVSTSSQKVNGSDSPSKKLSFSNIVSSVPDMLTSIRRSFSIRKSGLVVPTEPNSTDNQDVALDSQIKDDERIKDPVSLSNSNRIQSMKNLPIEINTDFVKYLDYDERMKVVSLVKYLREGENNPKQEAPIDDVTNKTPSFMFRYTIASRFSASGSTKSHRHYSQRSGQFIVISTDDSDDHEYLRSLPVAKSASGAHSPKGGPSVNPDGNHNASAHTLVVSSQRRSSINTTNRIEGMKNSILDSFNSRVGRASILMQKNR